MKKTGFLVSLLLICVNIFAQNQTALLKGKVLDDKNNPLEGVNISIKGLAGGTRSDEKGNFSLLRVVLPEIAFCGPLPCLPLPETVQNQMVLRGSR